MKTRYIYTVMLMALVGWGVLKVPRLLTKESAAQHIALVRKADPRFGQTEDKISDAKKRQDVPALLRLNQSLQAIDSPESVYWQAYSLFQVAMLQNGAQHKDEAKQYVDQAIRVLDQVSAKDSEDYALLALMRSFSIKFLSFFNVSSVAQQAKQDGLKAIENDSTNMRAFLVAGLSDFYTPLMFGGQKEAEKLLTKALLCSNRPGPQPGNIHWGQDQVFGCLQKFYEQRGKLTQAETIRRQAVVRFPNDTQFKPHPIAPPTQAIQ